MSATATPYGLIPIKKLGGQVYNGSFSQYPIAANYGTAIYQGDLVKLTTAAGTIAKDTGTTTAAPIGVFIGCTYTDPSLKYKVQKNFWTASTVASDAYAYVVDDPDVIFKIQGSQAVTQTIFGTNCALVQGSGNATTGISGVTLDTSAPSTTSTLPIKVVGVDPSNLVTATYPDLWVIINIGTHMWRNATGIDDA